MLFVCVCVCVTCALYEDLNAMCAASIRQSDNTIDSVFADPSCLLTEHSGSSLRRPLIKSLTQAIGRKSVDMEARRGSETVA